MFCDFKLRMFRLDMMILINLEHDEFTVLKLVNGRVMDSKEYINISGALVRLIAWVVPSFIIYIG